MEGVSWRNWANLAAYGANAGVTFASSQGLFGPDNTELSRKYQTLLTPAGTAFSIWGIIFLGEAVFAVAQMLPQFRSSKVVELVTPGWLVACFFQCAWSIIFAQELIVLSFFLIAGILVGLLMIALVTDGCAMTWGEYFLLRWPFSLHLGWVIAATVLNVSVMADSERLSPERLLEIAVTSVGFLCISTTFFAMVMKSADPTVCFVAAWAFNFIRVELSDPTNLDNPSRHNPYTWDRVTLTGLQGATANAAVLCLVLAGVAIARASWNIWGNKTNSGPPKDADPTLELVDGAAQGA